METTVPPTSPPAAGTSERAESTPPRTPADIPGLGPIRVRALQKAGLGTLDELRAASLDDLRAVPGLSEIKARHILDYLAQFPVDRKAPGKRAKLPRKAETPAPAPPQEVVTAAAAPPEPDTEDAPHEPDAEPEASAATLLTEATQAAHQVATLLTSERAAQLRPRLVRALTHCTTVIEALRGSGEELSAKERARAIRQLRRVLGDLTELIAHPDLDRKAQARIAESLVAAGDKLARP